MKDPARTNLIHACYETCDLITFYTINEKELHAWAIPQGTPALTAAGMIHSDFEKGFIRAEVIDWKTLIDAGEHAEARKKGFLRTEGKQYPVRDREVINFLFKV